MNFAERILSISKRLIWSQDDLAEKDAASSSMIGRHKRNEIKPTIDITKAIADVLDVSVNFLLGGDDTIRGQQLLQKIKDINQFDEEELNNIYDPIDMVISYHKAKKAYSF